VDKINGSGGFGDAGNKSYWLGRMGQSWGGVGDYAERPEADMNKFYGNGTTADTTTNTGASGTGDLTGTGGTPGATGTMSDAVRKYIMDALAQDPNATTIEDPAVKGAADAYRNSRENAMNKQNAALAERRGAQGLGSSGALDTDIAGSYQSMGSDVAGNNAKLIMDQQQKKLDQAKSALAVGAGLMTAEQENAVRMQIANLEADVTRRAQDLQNTQYYDNLDYLLGTTEAQYNQQSGSV
jgi:hypothetical protein